MKLSTETITPEFAQQLLDGGANNRPISESVVQKYVTDMRAGLWNNNGQGLIFTEDMKLLDGQHRLAAVIASGIPTEFNITVGVDPAAFVTMDSGKSRALSDVLAIEGFKNTVTYASVVRGAYAYISGLSYGMTFTKTILEAFAKRHSYAQEIASLMENSTSGIRIPKGPIGCALFLANEKREMDKEVRDFVAGVVRGEGLYRGDARLALRDWIGAQRGTRGALKAEVVFAATVRAWNAFSTGKDIVTLRGLDDATIRGLPIFGFQRSFYKDVPDLYEAWLEARTIHQAKASARGKAVQMARLEAKRAAEAAKPPPVPARGSIGRSTKA